MKTVKGYVRTNKVGSTCEFSFEVDDDCPRDDIEELAKEAMFDRIEWNFTVDGEESE